MPNFGSFATPIFPPWATLLGAGDDVQGQTGGPDELRTEAGVYLFRDTGKLSAQYNGALGRVQLSAQPPAIGWDTDGWAPGDAEAGYEIRGVLLHATTTPTNLVRATVTMVDTQAGDTPVACLAFGTAVTLIGGPLGTEVILSAAAAELPLATLPLFFRQQNTRWGFRLDVYGSAAVPTPVLCDILYAESLPGIELDRG